MTKHRLTFGMESAAVLGLLVLAAAAGGCDTGVPSSPEPGIFRLELQRDISATTSIRVAGNQFVLGNDTTRAALQITLTDARAYRDTNYAELTRNLRTVEEADATLNVLEDSQTEATKTYTLYEMDIEFIVNDEITATDYRAIRDFVQAYRGTNLS